MDRNSLSEDQLLDSILRAIMDITAEDGGAREDASHPPEAYAEPPDASSPLRCTDGEKAILGSYVTLMRQYIELAEKMKEVPA